MSDSTPRHGFREWARAPLEYPVRLYFGEAEVVEARTINLSAGGFFVPMRPVKPVGTLLRFELELPDQVAVAGFGEVVWLRVRAESGHRPAGLGVRYRYLEDPAREAIRSVVARREAEEAKFAATPSPASASVPGAESEDETVLLSARPHYAADPAPAGAEGPAQGEVVPAAASSTLFETAARLQEASHDPRRKQRLGWLLGGLAAVLALALGVSWLVAVGFGGSEPPALAKPAVRKPRKAKPAPPAAATAAPAAAAATGEAPPAEPAPASPQIDLGPPFTRVLGLSAQSGPDATTLRIELDGVPESARILSTPIGSGSPRHLLRLLGVREAVEPAVLMVGSNEIRRVRSGLHGRPDGSELHLVIDLAGGRVRLDSLSAEGRGLVLRFVEAAAQERR
ncbi:MAG TPA: PilZ domain-containing protein [Thermoanaerobaculia bacterium]|nr:PilZ domain-containing protein [Thermoanaerobaculia bacterium]